MLHIDIKYASLLSTRLRNFKKKNDYLWNFSCPVCGDSKSNQRKARGYIYRFKTDLMVKCHRCGYGANIGKLIKHIDSNLYDQYVIERYKDGATRYNDHKDITKDTDIKFETPKIQSSILSKLKRLDEMTESHPAVKYVIDRKIPKDKWNLLYYAPKFKKFVNSVTPKFQEPITGEHPRLIIPYFNSDGNLFAFQGRAFGAETPKYFTIKIDENEEKIYGLERIDRTQKVYIVEGPIDSLFVPNSIAVSGSSFNTPVIADIKHNATIIMDNEPRSKEITKQLSKYIDLGYSVVMYPDSVREKDINEMILNGKTEEQILDLINTNTFSGVTAKLKFADWRKCEG